MKPKKLILKLALRTVNYFVPPICECLGEIIFHTLEFMLFCAVRPHLHMVLKTPRGSRAVLRASRCSGNTNHSECSLPELPRWNRFLARLSWEQLTGSEGWLMSTLHQSPCCWMVTRRMPAHPWWLALALLS